MFYTVQRRLTQKGQQLLKTLETVSQDWAFQKQQQSNYFFLQSQHVTVVHQDFSTAQKHCLLQHQCEFHFTLYFIVLFFSTVVTFGHDLVSDNCLS